MIAAIPRITQKSNENKWLNTKFFFDFFHLFLDIQKRLGQTLSSQSLNFRKDFSKVVFSQSEVLFQENFNDMREKYLKITEELYNGKEDRHYILLSKYFDTMKNHEKFYAFYNISSNFTKGKNIMN